MERTFTCAEFEILLADWIDGTLDAPGADENKAAERDAFLRHLESCKDCAEFAEDARFTLGFIDRSAEVECPQVLVSKILHATNSGFEFKLRGRGLSGWINRTFAPVLRPRIVMGALFTLMSLTIMAKGCGLQQTTFTAADLDPVRLWTALDNRVHHTWDQVVKSYESMRLVYEVRTQMEEWSQQQKQEQEAAADARADQRKIGSPKEQPNPDAGSQNRK